MHRVELKGGKFSQHIQFREQFLMHRVELKDFFFSSALFNNKVVPNAPCGVESTEGGAFLWMAVKSLFLMHRVELKVSTCMLELQGNEWEVPNAPCGVESSLGPKSMWATSCVPNAPCGVESSTSLVMDVATKKRS